MGEGAELLLFLQAAKMRVSARIVRSFFYIMEDFLKKRNCVVVIAGVGGDSMGRIFRYIS